MALRVAPSFLLEVARVEAEARGLSRRLAALVEERVAFDMDGFEAGLDAVEALGLGAELAERLSEAAAGLDPLGVSVLEVDDAHAGMPTLRRAGETTLRFTHDVASFGTLATSLGKLVALFAVEPERTEVSLAVGLGGTGGCATGECLPEDAPAGPLFERVARG
jgi:hypothetical protein